MSLAEYVKRFAALPARLLDTAKDAPAEYHDRLTVAKSFALAIDEASKLHPAAEPLIIHASLLAPEPIPLFLFSEGREKFGEPMASQLSGDGLDEAVGALRAFALVDRETILDERDPSITADSIRLHRLVRAVAGTRLQGEAVEGALRALLEVMAAVYQIPFTTTRTLGLARGCLTRSRSIWSQARATRRAARSCARAISSIGSGRTGNARSRPMQKAVVLSSARWLSVKGRLVRSIL